MKNIILVLLLYVFLCGCGDNSTSPSSPQINIGAEVKLVQQSISSSGGTIVVNRPGDSLNGLTIITPPNSYPEAREFKISTASITNHSFGSLFHPITPVIKISNGGGYSDSILSLKIPINVPNGQFAMAFMYDRTTGELEGLPISELESDHITIATRHFAHTSMGGLGKGIMIAAEDAGFTEIIVSTVDTNELMKDHFTPFKPGVDDWQFTNRGSYISPNGICSGQAISMLWYYSQKKLKGSPPLFGRFDNDGFRKTPKLWQDDVQGYRFCSMLQLDQSTSISNRLLEKWQGKDDIRTLRAFSYSLRLTNSPQYVGIDNLKEKVGHAMVVYGISRGTLFIADPNRPGDVDTRIRFDEFNHIYQPYFTGLKAGDPGTQFPIIHYLAKTGINDWNKATDQWKSIANGTIGKGKFPAYTIVALDENDDYVPLTDGFKVPLGGRLSLLIHGKGFESDFMVFNSKQEVIPRDGSTVLLPPGKNLIGIVITDAAKNWIDFKWINVDVEGDNTQGPTTGKLKMNIWIDGEKQQIYSSIFYITETYPNYYNVSIFTETYFSADSTNRKYIQLQTAPEWGGVKNEGELNKFYTSWSKGNLFFQIKDSKDGNMKIDAWSYERIEGSFSCTGYTDGNLDSSKIYGDFHYVK